MNSVRTTNTTRIIPKLHHHSFNTCSTRMPYLSIHFISYFIFMVRRCIAKSKKENAKHRNRIGYSPIQCMPCMPAQYVRDVTPINGLTSLVRTVCTTVIRCMSAPIHEFCLIAAQTMLASQTHKCTKSTKWNISTLKAYNRNKIFSHPFI